MLYTHVSIFTGCLSSSKGGKPIIANALNCFDYIVINAGTQSSVQYEILIQQQQLCQHLVGVVQCSFTDFLMQTAFTTLLYIKQQTITLLIH